MNSKNASGNNIDPENGAHHEPPDLDLFCWQI